MKPLRGAAAAAVASALGAVHTLAYVHTAAWWLPLLCVAALVALVAQAPGNPPGRLPAGRAALCGWAFGLGWLGAGVWWLFISLHRYGNLSAPLAALAVAALAAALSLYWAVAFGLFARLRSGRPWGDGLLFAALWLLAELARGVLFTGFPWLASGYSQVDAPLAALAPWVGVYGMGAALALGAAWLALGALARLPLHQRIGPQVAALALWLLPALAGPGEFTEAGRTLQVSLLQTNVAQDEKFALERMPQALAWLAQEMARAPGDLVVAPETAVPLLPGQLQEFLPDYWPQLRAAFAGGERAALVGMPQGDYDSGYANSVLGLAGTGTPYRYDKTHLVPFGEFIPRGFRWFTEALHIPLGDFTRGPRQAPSFEVRGERVAPNICYEDLFGEELALRFADAAQAPTVFANVSNIGWFGDTIAVAQHLNISRLRTLEFQRPMLRATNTGATALVDHRGRVQAQLPPFSRGVLSGAVQPRSGLTPFAAWAARFGLAPLALAALGVVAMSAWRRRGS